MLIDFIDQSTIGVSVTDNCCDYLGKANPKHVIQLCQFHYSVGGASAPLIKVLESAERHKRAVSPEFPHQLLHALCPVGLVQNVKEKEDQGSYKGHQHSHNPDIGPDHFDNFQYFVNYPLKPCHVTFLYQLILNYPVVDLFLGEVDVVRE